MAELRKKTGNKKGIRHALTLEQQRAFMSYIEHSTPFYAKDTRHCYLRRVGNSVFFMEDDKSM